MTLDVLAFGVHPDDVELGCGGVLLKERALGKKIGIVDLTQGEMGTRGTAETRKEEAKNAGLLLGVEIRENLAMADGFFENNQEHQLKVIQALRKYRPEIIFCNAPEDRHPDHGRSSSLVEDSAFLSGLLKIETFEEGKLQEPFRPKYVFKYLQDRFLEPDFIYDITNVFEQKIEAVKAYKTQFYNPELNEPETYISTPAFLESIIYRAKMLGKMIGVKYAEGFISTKKIGINSLDVLVKENT